MTLDLTQMEYVACLWLANSGSMDFLGALYRLKSGEWEIKYRFRYHLGDLPNAKDERNWYSITDSNGKKGPEKMEKAFDLLMGSVGMPNFRKVEVRGDDCRAIEVLAASEPSLNFEFRERPSEADDVVELEMPASEKVTVAELLSLYPLVEWRAPLPIMQAANGPEHFGCRICIAQNGLSGLDVPSLPTTQEVFDAHMKSAHDLEGMTPEPLKGAPEARAFAAIARKWGT
jgi:hypothetical protein